MADKYKILTSSGVVTGSAAILKAFWIRMDGTNDEPGLQIYNHASAASGDDILSSCPFEADYKGLNGATGLNIDMRNGIYVAFTGTNVKVTIIYENI